MKDSAFKIQVKTLMKKIESNLSARTQLNLESTELQKQARDLEEGSASIFLEIAQTYCEKHDLPRIDEIATPIINCYASWNPWIFCTGVKNVNENDVEIFNISFDSDLNVVEFSRETA